MLEDGKIKKNDEMKKLPFVMVRLLTVGSDNVIKSFQEVSDAIYVVFDNEDEDEDELIKKLGSFMENIDEIRKQNLNGIAEKYDWSNMVEKYDDELANRNAV